VAKWDPRSGSKSMANLAIQVTHEHIRASQNVCRRMRWRSRLVVAAKIVHSVIAYRTEKDLKVEVNVHARQVASKHRGHRAGAGLYNAAANGSATGRPARFPVSAEKHTGLGMRSPTGWRSTILVALKVDIRLFATPI
jgi:hypothetical protein